MANPTATLDTSLGSMEIEIYADKMPLTAANFIKLAKNGFYPDMKKIAGEQGWALLEKYVGPLTT